MKREQEQPKTTMSRTMAEIYEWLEAIAFALAIVVLLFTFVFRIVSVNGDSMNPTLHDEDRVLVSTLFYEPKVRDVVIVVKPFEGQLEGHSIVKRIVALENDEVNIIDGVLYVNGVAEEKLYEDMLRTGDAFEYPVIVPEGCVFVLGDNRNDSTDSRSSDVGMVEEEYILGKVSFRLYPFDSIEKIEE